MSRKSKEVARPLPMPAHLEPQGTEMSLAPRVRGYFYDLYNAANSAFRGLLESVDNKTAKTGNRYFDRHEAVRLIKDAAEDAKDGVTQNAKDGEIYRHIVNILRNHDLGLKQRRLEYKRQPHATPAE